MVSHDPNLKEFIAISLDDSCFTPLHLAIIRRYNHIVRLASDNQLSKLLSISYIDTSLTSWETKRLDQ